MTVRELHLEGTLLLKGLPQPALEAKVLLFKAASLDEKAFYSEPEAGVSLRVRNAYLRLVRRRLEGRPLGYVTGRKEFWSLSFKVGPGVLIPRPETELLVEKTIDLAGRGGERILDMGTGSGNIAVALASELPRAVITAADVSPKALRTAAANARTLGCARIRFVRSDLFSSFRKGKDRYDIIVSNPPYIGREEWAGLSRDVRDHEPKRALVGGKKGLEFIGRLVRQAPSFLKPGGFLVFEIGAGQIESVRSLFGKGWERPEVIPDLAGIPRVVSTRLS
ncbi:MAG: peptide chain release factor N(5)-glutamine methyltransferase [Candidatus Aminicenantales bacterium]